MPKNILFTVKILSLYIVENSFIKKSRMPYSVAPIEIDLSL